MEMLQRDYEKFADRDTTENDSEFSEPAYPSADEPEQNPFEQDDEQDEEQFAEYLTGSDSQ